MTVKKVLEQVLIFDGAMGTLLVQKGLQPGTCPELWNLEAPEKIKEIHTAYLDAGADIITTNSFGGNAIKLAEYGLADKVAEINRQAVLIAKEAATASRKFVAASVGPTGQFVEPVGSITFQEMYEVFKEQIATLASAGPDFIILETFSDLGEIRAALLAARDVCDLPVICSLTFEGKRTLTGVSPASAAVVLESLGAAAIGANCSGGPADLFPVIQEMAANTNLPVVVQPNAGLPQVKDGRVVYPLDPQSFLAAMEPYFSLGINIFGSCCGSTPGHTRALKERLQVFVPPKRRVEPTSALASREEVVRLGKNLVTKIIGERINPTGRKDLASALREGALGVLVAEGERQSRAGAHLLDVNVGTPGVDQVKAMYRLVNMLQQAVTTPLVIDSTDPAVIETALRAYHGKALVNSVNGEEKSLKSILPLVKRYGAAVVALTLDEKGIPARAEERLAIAKRILEVCAAYGIPKEDVYVDCLVLPVGTDIRAVRETLRAIKLVKEKLGANTVLGISNVSHGLPNRSKLNGAFLAMAIAQGLDAAIIDPLDENMLNTWQAAALLAGRDPEAANYLKLNTGVEPVSEKQAPENQRPSLDLVRQLVVRGSHAVSQAVTALLQEGEKPLKIINGGLIPGLNEVGEKFARGEYYLPQLMRSAEAAQAAFTILNKELEGKQGLTERSTIVIGTVKGDIHDIGKNMVATMLRTHGYRVVDLGKNVPAPEFLAAAQREGAEFAALSALMTTTMMEIPKTIQHLKAALPDIKVIIGGAVVTPEFAREVGADGYGEDALSAVKVVEELRRKEND